jgi:hypothetical protein
MHISKIVSTLVFKLLGLIYGTEYVNHEFDNFLPEKAVLHQTSCPDTSPQNGVAERKNRYLLEIARSLMFTMNVPKFLWSEVVMTNCYLSNQSDAIRSSWDEDYV